MSLTRRELIGAGIAGAAVLATPASAVQRKSKRKAKNIIFCVSDGMAASTMSMADQFQRLAHGKQSYWSWLMEQEGVVNGLQETRSLSSVVTDSSAASSAWGAGRRIWNGQTNMYPDGTPLRTLTDLMHSIGVRTGLVTTTTITHATPSGFAVSCLHRSMEPQIAELYLKSGVSVLMGGGDKFFSATSRKDKRDLYADFARTGYTVIRRRNDLLRAKGNKLLGIFSSSHIPFTVDRDNDLTLQATVPTLAEMAHAAIDNLKNGPKGFLLQIEGGKVDHAAHGNDLAGMIYDQIAFEDAVKVAVDFALKDGNTLVVITADHATGGPSLNGAGDEYFDSTAGIKTLAGMKCSYEPLKDLLSKAHTPGNVRLVVEAKLGIQLKPEEADLVVDALAKKWAPGLSSFEKSVDSALGIVLGNYSKVQWTSNNHTSDHVLVTAVGPGSEAFAGLTKNYSMFDMMLAHKDLKWSNPTIAYEEAAKHAKTIKDRIPKDGLEVTEDEPFW